MIFESHFFKFKILLSSVEINRKMQHSILANVFNNKVIIKKYYFFYEKQLMGCEITLIYLWFKKAYAIQHLLKGSFFVEGEG